jgi:uncharacterized membrane protein
VQKIIKTIVLLALATMPAAAFAYVGPGAGISLLGALWGLIVAVVMAISVILFWPVRIMLRKRKAKREAAASEAQKTEQDALPSA